MKNSLSILLCFTIGFSVYAQDKIYKKDKTIISCKVVDVGLNEVKYLESASDDGPTISIAVDELIKVVLSSGKVIEFKNPLTDPNSYLDNKKNAIKIHFMSPLGEHLSFSYEKSLKPGRSFESTFGLIGVGFNTNIESKSSGVTFSGGYKFMKTPDFYSQRYKYAHILKGSYVKPELAFSIYTNERNNFFFNPQNPQLGVIKQDIVAGAVLINIGKQVVYDDFFVVDYSVGLGYGFSNQERIEFDESGDFRPNHYGFLLGGNSFPVAFSAKIKIGLLW
jgi:hypothetical protein